jgi:hypothetical protein
MARPRGYADWSPKPDTLALIDQVQVILNEYRANLPMTARQIFYRLVGAYNYPKTERDYKNLCEKLVRARRAQMIGFDVIRDDGTTTAGGDWGYVDPASFWEDLKDSGRGYHRYTREGQEYRIELWCEAGGMVPQLERVAQDFGVRVYSTGGFSSVTVTHEIAQRALRFSKPTVFLHVGDYDPSGESIFDAMTTDALHFIAGHSGGGFISDHEEKFNPIRVALTQDQVAEHDLPTAPPKSSDSRSVNWSDETCQAEAMPPDLLAETVRDALAEWTDEDTQREVEAKADRERDLIVERLESIEFGEADDEDVD